MGRKQPGNVFVLRRAFVVAKPRRLSDWTIVTLQEKLLAPKRGWTLPGQDYTGPYNPLEQQLKYNPETGRNY